MDFLGKVIGVGGPGFLSGKIKYSVLLLVRFVTRIGNGSGILNWLYI
jgi:hypothetical protein